MKCPKCDYLMDPFDSECRRCHGKGIEKPDVVVAPPTSAAPQPVAANASSATAASSSAATDAPKSAFLPAQSAFSDAPSGAESAKSPSGVPPYFLAAYEARMFKDPLLFRVYGDSDALLFIQAGPYHIGMIDQFKKERGETATQAVEWGRIVRRTTMIGAVTGGASSAALGAGAAGAAAGLVWASSKVAAADVAKRAKVIDAMTLDELRQESKTGKRCFRVAPDNVSKVQLRPPSITAFSSEDDNMTGYLTFVHQPTGKWKMHFITIPDIQDAVREFRRVLGANDIDVQFPF